VTRLSDRTDPSTYCDEEGVSIAVVERDIQLEDVPEEAWLLLPESLFVRLLCLGQAYSLHFPFLVKSQYDWLLNSKQCEGFLEELQFLKQLISDDALLPVLNELVSKVEKVVRSSGMFLRFSPP
jgi:hypothetical protein